MSTKITYNGNEIANFSTGAKVLKCKDKTMATDVVIEVDEARGGEFNLVSTLNSDGTQNLAAVSAGGGGVETISGTYDFDYDGYLVYTNSNMENVIVHITQNVHNVPLTIAKGTTISVIAHFELEHISNCKAIVSGTDTDLKMHHPTLTTEQDSINGNICGSAGVVYDIQDDFYFAIVD